MKTRILALCSVAVVCLALGPSLARATTYPTLTIDSGGSNTLGGVYVGPYSFTLTSAPGKTSPLQLICDDANDDVYPPGEYWNFTTETFSDLNGAKFYSSTPPATAALDTKEYDEVGYLVEEMLPLVGNSANNTKIGEIQWALWDIFDPGKCGTGISHCDPYGSFTPSETTAIDNYLAGAQANYASGNYSNLMIYTPVAGTEVPAGDGPPQEYIGVDTAAEPGSFALLAVALLGFLLLDRNRRLADRLGLSRLS